jgi:hypothetical protein
MTLIGAIRLRPLGFLFGLAAVTLVALLLFVPPIPQSQSYHRYADQRTLLGVPHFWNVVTNLPFILVGALGLIRVRDTSARVFFAAVLLTGFSSSYCHWNPNDLGLFWDRLPMSMGFMAVLAIVIEERVDARVGRALLWPLVALGFVSLLIWLRFDDLRLYGWVQFFPFIALPLLFWLFPAKYTGVWYWIAAAGWYVLAKLFEHFDAAVYAATGQIMAGHALKHLSAACGCYAILRAFETRKPIAHPALA